MSSTLLIPGVLRTHSFLSAFAGMSVIIVLLPVPGMLAKLLRGVQSTRSKKVSNSLSKITHANAFLDG